MKVLKFGGTSVAHAENIRKVIDISSKNAQAIIVVSALGGVTDLLLDAAQMAASGDLQYEEKINLVESRHRVCYDELAGNKSERLFSHDIDVALGEIRDICKGLFMLGELTQRIRDRVAGYGEWLSSKIITDAFRAMGKEALWVNAKALIVTNSNFGSAQVDFDKTNVNIIEFFKNPSAPYFIVPGFIAADAQGVSTTLGRGGSDYTAAIFAAALSSKELEIWTDVSGMMTADPRACSNVRIIPHISYQEAMELSHFGAKVIYPPTIQPVMQKNIPVWIKNTFAPDDFGTRIASFEHQKTKSDQHNIITGISSMSKIALLTLEGSGMIGIPGFSKRLFESLSNEKINVILITQSSSEHSITVAISASESEKASIAVNAAVSNEIALKIVDPIIVENDLSIVALVGENMQFHTGVSGRMFSAMGRNGVNIRAIAQGSSEKNISAVIATADVRKTINVLHEEFFETSYKQVNVFIAGTGNVAGKLLSQIHKQQQSLLDTMRLQLRVTGIINSRKMLISETGIDLENWNEELKNAGESNLVSFAEAIMKMNLRNSIFVDVTANHSVADIYETLLSKSISVVACNKIAASSGFENYRKLKELAKEFNARFLYETNVGAGLPIIGTINDLIYSGDHIHSIQAVLSGTLNFVFNHYDTTRKFSDVVKQAQEEGYTEPDPRLDLGGTDVMRKIMILAREAGQRIEMNEIVNHSFMPDDCMKGTVDEFYKQMEIHESHFKDLFLKAQSSGNKLKFIASYENGVASVGLQEVPPQHDLYHLYGKDNAVLFYTDRYKDQPLVVKGAGAGAEVTASGVFADIIRASKI
jgi:aspartokinase/homoserine dehydrogenase 1